MTTTTIPNVTKTLPEHWQYVSEGGATIVFSYRGPPDIDFDGTVLRLRKTTAHAIPKPTRASDLDAQVVIQDMKEPDDPMIEYQASCMERLIPLEHLPRLVSVHVNRPWLEALVATHDVKRPAERRARDKVDLTRKKGVLATDLVGGDWLAVEIKPKWAFLPFDHHLSNTTRSIKTKTCRFCMHSHMRAAKGEDVALGYCPMDLFSGKEDRIREAVYRLWDAWAQSNGTVNNLKMFIRGKAVHPSTASSMFATPTEDIEDIREAFTSALCSMLTNTPVLRILSKLQRTLDCLDIEGLSSLWRQTETSVPLYRTTFASFFEQSTHEIEALPTSPIGVSSLFLSSPEPTISDWTQLLDAYLSPSSSQLDHSQPKPENLRYYLLAYLLSATFKDCSVIIRMEPLRPPTSSPTQIQLDRVTVIDLDPKSMDRLRKWEKLDRDIVSAYSFVKEPKICSDDWVE